MAETTITPLLVSIVSGTPSDTLLTVPTKPVLLDQSEADILVARGWAKFSETQSAPNNTNLDAIVDAIAELPSSAFDKDSKPNIKALQNILETKVSAKERDQAWSQFKTLKDS